MIPVQTFKPMQRHSADQGSPYVRRERWHRVGMSLVMIGAFEMGWMQATFSQAIPARSPQLIEGIEHLNASMLVASAEAVANFPSFNSQRLDQQIRLYAHYLAQSGPPDVLIVGSSRSLQGIDPVVLQQSLAARGYSNLRVYNFSINGATAQVVDLVLRRILLPNQLPRLIIWADGSRAFNSARVDVTYNGILSSEGYKQLAAGVRPIRPTPPRVPLSAPQSTSEFCVDLPPVATTQAGYGDYLDADESLLDSPRSRRSPSSTCVLLPPLVPPDPADSLPELLSAGTIAPDLNASGFQSVPTEFNPTTYYRQFPRVSGRYDSNYTPFQLEGEQTTAAIAIANFARSQNIPLVFVSLPLTQDYLDPTRNTYEQQFRQHMQQLATREGFLFRDLMQRWSTQNNYFADPSHLNRNGARAVAQYLATDATIPWPQRRSVSIRGNE